MRFFDGQPDRAVGAFTERLHHLIAGRQHAALLIDPESSLSDRRCTTVISTLKGGGDNVKGGAEELSAVNGAVGACPSRRMHGCAKVPVTSVVGGCAFSFEVAGACRREVSAMPAEPASGGGTFGSDDED